MQRAGSRASGGFLSTPSARRATAERQDADPPAEISIHALREEGDVAFFPVAHHCHNFYPRPPRGGRRYVQEFAAWVRRFLSTPSARRATFFSGGVFYWDEFLSTPSARRATPGLCPDAQAGRISIHALREEGDQKGEPITIPLNDFYPRPPRGGRRFLPAVRSPTQLFLSTPSARRATRAGIASVGLRQFLSTPSARRATLMGRLVYEPELFLSTPSARRATLAFMHCAGWTPYFYPRPLRGGRPLTALGYDRSRIISIHALCEEGDSLLLRPFIGLLLFLSTPSARRATPSSSASFLMSIISIHALCEEGDRILWKNFKRFMGISIHALCEEGDVSQNHNNTWSKSISIHALCEEGDFWSSARFCGASVFLSTPSARRATRLPGGLGRVPNISIHALCEEGDVVVVVVGSVEMLFLSTPSARRATKSCTATTKSVTNFYPRPLRGGRRIPQRLIHNDRRFLSTPSARRATQRQHHLRRRRGISIHALCEEGDRRSGCTSQLTQRFLSTPSARRATRWP